MRTRVLGTARATRIGAGALAVSAAVVGCWALFAPHGFYASFPGLGQHWIAPTGPYNEHFVRDIGGLYLALLVVSVWTVVRATRDMARLAAVAWLAFSIPHLIFHLSHLDELGTGGQIGLVVALGGTVLLAGVLFLSGDTSQEAS
jgi:hypothetical protein